VGDHPFHIPKTDTVHDAVLDKTRGRAHGGSSTKVDTSSETRRRMHEAAAAIEAKHRAMGGAPGAPVGEVMPGQGLGFYQLYTEGGIYWLPGRGASELYGAVHQRYVAMGGADSSFLGYPIKDQGTNPDGVGEVATFENGAIYWSPSHGAHEVHGAIRTHWESIGGAGGWLGYPVSDEYDGGQGRRSDFENGRISWTADQGAHPEPQWLHYTYSPIVFGTGLAIGGNATLTLYSDGSTHFQGHLHDSGLASYDTFIAAAVYDTGHNAIIFTHEGQANGGLSHGSPDDNWHEWKPSADVVALWSNLKQGSSSRTVNRVDGYLVFAKIVEFLGDVWNAFYGSSEASQDPSTGNPYYDYDATGEESVPPLALKLN
jgi:hypothetical protein